MAAKPSPGPRPISEARVKARTGHGWEHWFEVLDRFGRPTGDHRSAARHLAEDQGLDAWWSQAVLIRYEWERGLRQAFEGGRFEAELRPEAARPGWCRVQLPGEWTRLACRALTGTLGGGPFRGTFIPDGPRSFFWVSPAQMADLGLEPGQRVEAHLKPEAASRDLDLPSELADALAEDEAAQEAFDRLPPSHRREIAGYVDEAKKPETRARRAQKALAFLRRGKKG